MDTKYQPYIAVFVIIRNEKGEILLHQRANTGFLDGHYDFPSGHVEPGEDIRTAAVRELLEETGLTTRVEDLKLVHINQNHLDLPYLNFTFITQNWQGTPSILEPGKCSDMAFFAPDKLPEKCTLSVRLAAGTGFSSELGITQVTLQNYDAYMHAAFELPTN